MLALEDSNINNEYKIISNDGNHHIHGGKEGFNKKIWKITSLGQTII